MASIKNLTNNIKGGKPPTTYEVKPWEVPYERPKLISKRQKQIVSKIIDGIYKKNS